MEKQWSQQHKECKGCHSTERPHLAKGYCKPCYFKTPHMKAYKKKYYNPERSKRYMSAYWKNNPDKYEEHKKRVRTYQKTPHARQLRKVAVKRFRDKNPTYMQDYRKKRKKEKLAQGLCVRGACKQKAFQNTTMCEFHLKQLREYMQMYKQRKNDQKPTGI